MNPQEALEKVEQAITNRPELVSLHWGLFWKNGNFLVWPTSDKPGLSDLVCFVPDPNNPQGYTTAEWNKIKKAIALYLERTNKT